MYPNNNSQNNASSNGDGKKKQENPPSKVVHLRNLPLPNPSSNYQHEDLEGEVIQMGFQFGPIKDLLMMRKSGQAFLEMDTVEIAERFVNKYRDEPPQIGRHTVYVQYSKHKELQNVDNNHAQQQLRDRLEQARQGKPIVLRSHGYNNHFQNNRRGMYQDPHHMNYGRDVHRQHMGPPPHHMGGPGDMGAGDYMRNMRPDHGKNEFNESDQRRVLHIVIEKEKFPVTIHQFCELFRRHGTVQRIVMFKKSSDKNTRSSQVLVEMKDPIAAQSAQNAFNGANIYDGCNIMRIDFSNLPHLHVKTDTDQRWDYTRTPKPDNLLNMPPGGGDGRNMGYPMTPAPSAGAPMPNNFPGNPGFQNQMYPHQYPYQQQGMPNFMPNPYQQPPPMPAAPGQYQPAYDPSRGAPMGAAMHAPVGHHYGYHDANMSPVLCVSNMAHGQPDQQDITPYDLFILFGVYGDVHRVKILYEKRDSALVEFATPAQASIALKYLNNQKLRGREMKLKLSKYQKVNLPKDKSQDTHNLTEDYTNHHLHRFRKQGSKNYQNIYQPSDVLHLSNIPDGTTEEIITTLFRPHGKVVQFKFFKDPKMALIKMGSIEEAIAALIKTHNHKMSPNQHLRVSFSRGYLTP